MERQQALLILLFVLFAVAAIKIPSIQEERPEATTEEPNNTENIEANNYTEDYNFSDGPGKMGEIELNDSPGIAGMKTYVNSTKE